MGSMEAMFSGAGEATLVVGLVLGPVLLVGLAVFLWWLGRSKPRD